MRARAPNCICLPSKSKDSKLTQSIIIKFNGNSINVPRNLNLALISRGALVILDMNAVSLEEIADLVIDNFVNANSLPPDKKDQVYLSTYLFFYLF